MNNRNSRNTIKASRWLVDNNLVDTIDTAINLIKRGKVIVYKLDGTKAIAETRIGYSKTSVFKIIGE